MKHVWKGHGADSEIGNVSTRQAALNRLFIYLFIHFRLYRVAQKTSQTFAGVIQQCY